MRVVGHSESEVDYIATEVKVCRSSAFSLSHTLRLEYVVITNPTKPCFRIILELIPNQDNWYTRTVSIAVRLKNGEKIEAFSIFGLPCEFSQLIAHLKQLEYFPKPVAITGELNDILSRLNLMGLKGEEI